MNDWRKELENLMDYGNAHKDKKGNVYAFWEAIGNYGEWNSPKVVEVIRPILDSLLSEQESEHKKQMREAIEEGVQMGSEGDGYSSDHSADVIFLFKKYNCDSNDAE